MMEWKRKVTGWTFLCSALLVLTLAAGDAQAFINGTRAMGFSAKSLGRGGFDIAVADDSTGINVNPAGMAFVEGMGVADVNMSMLFPWGIRMTNPNNPNRVTDKDRFLLAPTAGLVYRPGSGRLALGFSFTAPDALATDWTIVSNYFNASPLTPGQSTSRMNAYSEWLHLRLAPAVAYQVNDRIAVGARIAVDYMTLDLRAPLGRAYLDLGTADAWGFSFGGGVLIKLTDTLRLGISGETQSYMGNLTSRAGDTFVKLDASGFPDGQGGQLPHGSIFEFGGMKASVADFESPPMIGCGLAFEPMDALLLGADFKYLFWSETNRQMTIELTQGDAGAFQAVSGVNTLVVPFNWEDAPAVAVGGSYRLSEMFTVRVGYNWGQVITEGNFVNYLSPVIFDHHLTFGGSVRIKGVELSAALIHSFKNTVSNSIPSGVDQSLVQQLGGLPLDSELSGMTVSGYMDTLALQFSYSF